MRSVPNMQPVFLFSVKINKYVSSRLLNQSSPILEKTDYGNVLLSRFKNQYLFRLPVPTVFLEQEGNQGLSTFRVVFKLSEVPSVERGKEPYSSINTSLCFKGFNTLHANLLTLFACGLLFLLVVGHSPAGEDHCGKDGKS